MIGGAAAASLAAAFVAPPAAAQDDLLHTASGRIDIGQLVTLSALLGVVSFAVISAVALMRARARAEAEAVRLREEAAEAKARAERNEALIAVDDQLVVVWETAGRPPQLIGRLPPSPGVPEDRTAFLAFGAWLTPDSAAGFDRAVASLRERGEPFALALTSQRGHMLEAAGRTVGGSAAVRFRDLSGERLELAELEQRHGRLAGELESLRAMLEASPAPAWVRGGDGRLAWVNAAYARAVEARDGREAAARGLELLDTAAREAIRVGRAGGRPFRKRVTAVAAGERRVFDVLDVALAGGSAGLAFDATDLESAHAALERLGEFHARTLDHLATPVAIFGPDRRLRFSNAAYRALFGLEPGFLESQPEDGIVLDRLRALRKLPEQADYRSWKAELLSAYRALETREHLWHLPDGQTLRVIANPHPEGGMTWIYENVTERLDLESRYNALIRMQRETLDHLAEGVAVFGSDGRLRLHNPALAAIWRLEPETLADRPHVNTLVAACRRLHADEAPWQRLAASIAGLDDGRPAVSGRMERGDGRVIDYACVPLPNGQSMLAFVDVTDSVQVARALTERNEALEAADGLKNAFIQHVSYELRSPLTNIIGFAQLLTDPRLGELSPKQREYAGYILSSSSALLAIINDILDLATLDAGITTLEPAEVDVAGAVAAVEEALRDRLQEPGLQEPGIRLELDIPDDIGSFTADERRVRQILYNLLANAIAFSPPGGRVRLTARRDKGIVFSVRDEGPGMPADFVPQAFDRFESRPNGAARGGAGLGLSIVKSFVELHGGSVAIDSAEGAGTTVTVRLPLRPAALPEAAE